MRFDEEKFFSALEEDAALPAESRAFAPDQLVECVACARRNPPTRMNCLYCGAALAAVSEMADLRRPILRALEEWEQGFNVVLPSGGRANLARGDQSEVAEWLGIESGALAEMLRAAEPLPLARVATREEGELIQRKLTARGLSIEVIADEDLAVESQPPRRVRRLECGTEELRGWARVEEAAESFQWSEINLIVPGRIQRKRIETDERRKRVAADAETVESREFYADESVLDIYSARSVRNWRIVSENFDYSCLGASKALLTTENFRRLAEVLKERAPSAVYQDDYRRVRHLLRFAWPPDEQAAAGGLRRSRPGRFLTAAVLSLSNERQFTRYGRLVHHFINRQEAFV
ncbi:hypothetical protein BH18ACI2_BH18ACI2_10930 [soil metagenome]